MTLDWWFGMTMVVVSLLVVAVGAVRASRVPPTVPDQSATPTRAPQASTRVT